MVEALSDAIRPIRDAAGQPPASERLNELVKDRLAVFIYFANYGILDSAVWLPRFLDDLNSHPTNARVRTIDAMFKHVGLKVKDIARLGKEQPKETPEQVAEAQRLKEERAIKLNFRCLMSGAPLAPAYVKSEGRAGRMGVRLMAIVAGGDRERVYLNADPGHVGGGGPGTALLAAGACAA